MQQQPLYPLPTEKIDKGGERTRLFKNEEKECEMTKDKNGFERMEGKK